jgi:hypothetical protein
LQEKSDRKKNASPVSIFFDTSAKVYIFSLVDGMRTPAPKQGDDDMTSIELIEAVQNLLGAGKTSPANIPELCRAEQLLREANAQRGVTRRKTLGEVRRIVEACEVSK